MQDGHSIPKYEDLPGNVVNYAKRSILDTMGVIIGGSGYGRLFQQ